MLIEPPSLQKGQQEISILINADTGVAGKLRPGDLVDVLATFQPDDQSRSPASARTIIRRARIVTIGLPRAAARPGGTDNALRAADATQQQVLVPVTFALRPTLSLRLTYAETFASEIRLSLIRRGDETRKLPTSKREYTLPPTRARTPEDDAMKARLALGLTDSDRAAQVIALAEEAGEIQVVATPQTSDDVIAVLAHTEVEVLVLDEELGPLPVLELARQLQAKHPAVGLLLLAAREATPDLLRQAVRAGFRDVLAAPMTVEALADATARGATWAQAVRERSEADDLARVAEHIGGSDHRGRRRQGRRRLLDRRPARRAGRCAATTPSARCAWPSSTCRPATCARCWTCRATAASPTWPASPRARSRSARWTTPSTCTPPACACCSRPSAARTARTSARPPPARSSAR